MVEGLYSSSAQNVFLFCHKNVVCCVLCYEINNNSFMKHNEHLQKTGEPFCIHISSLKRKGFQVVFAEKLMA